MITGVEKFIKVFLPTLISLVGVIWIYFKVLHFSLDKNLVDNPNARKLQKSPVPVMGGMAVFFGVLCGSLIACCLFDCTQLIPIFLGMGLMLYLGVLDDHIGLTPVVRLFFEVAVIAVLIYGGGACVDSLHGLWGIGDFSWWLGVPLTIFAGVGIINAMNMIDGVNGLSSGLCLVCSAMFGIALYRGQDIQDATICFCMAAALIPFLIHNVIGYSSKMFIGDAGSMVMGVLMSWCVIQVLRADTKAGWLAYEFSGMCLIALVFAILAVPVMDTIRVMFMRMLHGKSPFSADKTHLHHILFKYSGSHSLTSITEIGITFLIVIVWAVSYKLDLSIDWQFYVTFGAAVILVWGTYFMMDREDRLNTGIAVTMRKALRAARQGNHQWWLKLQIFIDTPRGIDRLGAEKKKDE
ncbi:MAG: undecaprenyl/decaprenyl-phosphate alpha-N-acetylglucosaminyl 1-phosphate transferase [Bacteroidales bacterium]|nr:undecaprenyl/decaprenyl-phosphate alpha-N-acetylglucosaminyl 1-phosphate transferase [Bacteroidales bacterium]